MYVELEIFRRGWRDHHADQLTDEFSPLTATCRTVVHCYKITDPPLFCFVSHCVRVYIQKGHRPLYPEYSHQSNLSGQHYTYGQLSIVVCPKVVKCSELSSEEEMVLLWCCEQVIFFKKICVKSCKHLYLVSYCTMVKCGVIIAVVIVSAYILVWVYHKLTVFIHITGHTASWYFPSSYWMTSVQWIIKHGKPLTFFHALYHVNSKCKKQKCLAIVRMLVGNNWG